MFLVSLRFGAAEMNVTAVVCATKITGPSRPDCYSNGSHPKPRTYMDSFVYQGCHIDQNPYQPPSVLSEGQSKHVKEPSAFATAIYVVSMLYPTIMTMAVYMAVMIGDNTELRAHHERDPDSITNLALSTSVLINMTGIGFVPVGLFWTFVPPTKKLLFGNRYVMPMRIMYLVTGIAAFVLLCLILSVLVTIPCVRSTLKRRTKKCTCVLEMV